MWIFVKYSLWFCHIHDRHVILNSSILKHNFQLFNGYTDDLNSKWVFYKRSSIQKCQYCQLCLNCAIRTELDQWIEQPQNVILWYPQTSNFILTISFGTNKEGNWKYSNTKLVIKAILPICAFVKNSNGTHRRACHFSTSDDNMTTLTLNGCLGNPVVNYACITWLKILFSSQGILFTYLYAFVFVFFLLILFSNPLLILQFHICFTHSMTMIHLDLILIYFLLHFILSRRF